MPILSQALHRFHGLHPGPKGPALPAFRAALRAYMQWAVSEVALSHPNDSKIPPDLPVPHWSSDGLQAD